MAYWHVQGGYYPEIPGGVADLEDMLFHCRYDWFLTEEELNEVMNDWLESHPSSDGSNDSDSSNDSDYVDDEEESDEEEESEESDDI